MLKSFRAIQKKIQNEEHYQEVINNGKKKLILRFLKDPKEFCFEFFFIFFYFFDSETNHVKKTRLKYGWWCLERTNWIEG